MVTASSECENTETASHANAPERTKISNYEQSREERIKENRERMQKLGIFDLSLQVKSHKPSIRSRKPPCARSTPLSSSPLPCPGPVRRSSRLQNVTPVSYSEAPFTNKDKSLSSEAFLLREEGAKPEFYTEEHDKLLGSTEMKWELFVDGVGKDGKRIYDSVKGKTCHQCRQKTLGLRTHCSNCNMVQGQFCGDCLYMRYGENVIEANQNANWICPVCRGICNCSLCRQAKGWPPTGPLYRKITSLGYKSVAHFLIQTRRLKSETETDSDIKAQVSAKRSLASTFIEKSTEMLLTDFNVDPQVSKSPEHNEGKDKGTCDNEDDIAYSECGDGLFKQEENTKLLDKEQGDCEIEEEKTQFLDTEQCQLDAGMMKSEMNAELPLHLGSIEKETDVLVDNQHDRSYKEQGGCKTEEEMTKFLDTNQSQSDTGMMKPDMNAELPLHLGSREKETDVLVDNQHDCNNNVPGEDNGFVGSFHIDLVIEKTDCGKKQQDKIDCTVAPESSTMSKNRCIRTIETTDDNIAGRLRVRHKRDNEGEDHRSTGDRNGTPEGNEQDKSDTLPRSSSADNLNSSSQKTTVDDNISKRLRKRCNEKHVPETNNFSSSSPKVETTTVDVPSPVTAITSSKSKRKPTPPSEPYPDDSIGARLRQRRVQTGGGGV